MARALGAVASTTFAPPSAARRLPGITVRGVDELVRAELLRQRAFVLATCDGHGAKPELRRELHPEVAEAADPEDGNGVAAACDENAGAH